jgi:hypothetical protein
MKKLFLTAIIGTLFIFSAQRAEAQHFAPSETHVMGGIGFLGTLNYGASLSRLPGAFIAVDHGTDIEAGPGTVGIGGFLGFDGASSTVSSALFGTIKSSWNSILAGARLSWHYNDLGDSRFDVYGTVGGGIRYTQNSAETTVIGGIPTSSSQSDIYPYLNFNAGAKYFFSPEWAVMAELGYDIAWLKVGMAYQLP